MLHYALRAYTTLAYNNRRKKNIAVEVIHIISVDSFLADFSSVVGASGTEEGKEGIFSNLITFSSVPFEVGSFINFLPFSLIVLKPFVSWDWSFWNHLLLKDDMGLEFLVLCDFVSQFF